MVELVEYLKSIEKKKKLERSKSIKRMRTLLNSFTTYDNSRDIRSMYVNTLSEKEDTYSIWQSMYVNYGPEIDDSVFEGMRY